MAIDYRLNVINPLEAAVSGFEAGQSLLGRRQEQEQRLGLIAAQQREAEMRAAEVQAKLQQAQQMQTDLAAFAENPNPTAKDTLSLIGRYPTLGDAVKTYTAQRTTEENAAAYNDMVAVYNPLRIGDTKGARRELENRRQAAANSGDAEKAKVLEGQLAMFDQSPEAVRAQLAIGMAFMNPEQFKKTEEAFEAYRGSDFKTRKEALELEQGMANLGLTKAQTNQVNQATRKLGVEIGKVVLDMEAAKSAPEGIVDPEKRFDAEEKIRKEYSAKAAGYNSARDSYSQMLASVGSKTGSGDTALITTFRKILDPGSVVRETEFAQSQNVGGIINKLDAYTNQISGEGLLNDVQRKEIIDLAAQFMNAANEYEKKRRADYMRIVDTYGLDPENVFGLQAVGEIAMPAGTAPPPPPAAPAGRLPAGRGRILSVTPAAAPSGVQGPRE
jgi:hypothetical protein